MNYLAAAFLRRRFFGAAAGAAFFDAAFLRRFFGAAGAAAFLRRFGAVFFAAATYFSYRNGSDPSPKPVACISVTEMEKFRQYIVRNIRVRVADYFFIFFMHLRKFSGDCAKFICK